MLKVFKPFVAGLLLTCAFFTGACFGPSDQDTLTQGSFGYRFEPGQELARGSDDEPTFSAGGGGSEVTSTPGIQGNPATTPSPTSQTPIATPNEATALNELQEEAITGRKPPNEGGLLESNRRIIILVVLAVIAFIASIGVVLNW